jgi:hypothetical protein
MSYDEKTPKNMSPSFEGRDRQQEIVEAKINGLKSTRTKETLNKKRNDRPRFSTTLKTRPKNPTFTQLCIRSA